MSIYLKKIVAQVDFKIEVEYYYYYYYLKAMCKI